MIGPYPVAPVIDRLTGHCGLKVVSQAADLRTAIEQQPAAVPAAYVLRQERPRSQAGASGGVLIQEVLVDLIVVLFVRNVADPTGSAAARQMDTLLQEVRGRLMNWTPNSQLDPLSFRVSRDSSFRGGLLIVEEFYQSRYRLQVNSNE